MSDSRRQNGAQETPRTARQLISEIRLLIDYISTSSIKSLAELEVEDPAIPDSKNGFAKISGTAVLLKFDDISTRLAGGASPLTSEDTTFLQLLRDALCRMAYPATDQTIAYTTLVTEDSFLRVIPYWHLSERARHAREAAPNLTMRAARHRFYHFLFLIMAAAFTYLAVDLSVEVATGKYILQTFDILHSRQTTISELEKQAETNADKLSSPLDLSDVVTTAGTLDLRAFRLCDRGKVLTKEVLSTTLKSGDQKMATVIAEQLGNPPERNNDDPWLVINRNPEERQICGRDFVLQQDMNVAHATVQGWLENGSSEMGGIFLLDNTLVRPVARKIVGVFTYFFGPAPPPTTETPRVSATNNSELQIPPRILSVGNYLLPVTFGLLGSLLYVILDYSDKIRRSRLSPVDSWVSWIRLILGVVVGACIGLFFTEYAPTTTSAVSSQQAGGGTALINSLSLSASGLAFLAGFGVEGVFDMLRAANRRVFSSSPSADTK